MNKKEIWTRTKEAFTIVASPMVAIILLLLGILSLIYMLSVILPAIDYIIRGEESLIVKMNEEGYKTYLERGIHG